MLKLVLGSRFLPLKNLMIHGTRTIRSGQAFACGKRIQTTPLQIAEAKSKIEKYLLLKKLLIKCSQQPQDLSQRHPSGHQCLMKPKKYAANQH